MSKEKYLITSESVTEGHPDKLADQISDGVLDAILQEDPMGRVACETLVTTGLVVVTGEISTSCYVDIPRVVRALIKDVGYTRAKYGFDGDTCAILSAIDEQSADIAQGVDQSIEVREHEMNDGEIDLIGAGDQGLMIGYACDETEELMPMPISLAHQLARRLAKIRKELVLPYLRPDGKTQVTLEYENEKPVRVDTIVVSTQHHPAVDAAQIHKDIEEHVIRPVIPGHLLSKKPKILVNPTGRFVMGGPQADSGLTGRKIIVDTYGGVVPHGGGAFSGKDPTKVDRSAAYMSRYAAKNIVAAGLAERCEIQVSYAIGVAQPTSISLNTFGTGKISDEQIIKLVRDVFDLRPYAITNMLDLLHPMYQATASYGHFGRTPYEMTVGDDTFTAFTWEKTDRAEALRAAAGL